MIVTTSQSIPDTEIVEIIGVVHGISVEPRVRGELLDPKEPEKFSVALSQNTERARNIATKRMLDYATHFNADAVIGVQYSMLSPQQGYIQVFAYGTAVLLKNMPEFYLKRGKARAASDQLEVPGSGTPEKEVPPVESPAVTPAEEHGVSIVPMDEKDVGREEVIDSFMTRFEIDRERSINLYDAGFVDADKLSGATVQELLAVDGVNPTMARLIKSRI